MNLRDADPETAWLAGIVEGEGCFGLYRYRYRSSIRWRPLLRVRMTDQDIVQELHRVAGIGRLGGPYKHLPTALGTSRLDTWCWEVQSHTGFQSISEQLYPYLGTRRRAKIEEIYREAPWIQPPYFFEEEPDGHRTVPEDLQTNLPLVLGTIRDRSPGTEILPSVSGEASLMDL